MSSALLVVFICLGIYDCIAAERNGKRWAKPLLMPLLAVYYVSLGRWDWRIVAALICGFGGDTFLLSNKDSSFGLGLCSFLIGHIFYIWFFAGFGRCNWLVFCLLVIYAVIVMKRLLVYVPGNMKAAVLVYMSALLCMCWSAFSAYWFAGIGGILFVLSDTRLAFQVFGKKPGSGIMETYLAGQLLLVLGAFALTAGV